jgi:hypothetical protein
MFRKSTQILRVGDIEIEKLVELVRVNPVLYDLGHKDYLNTTSKVNTWRSIAEAMGIAEIDGTTIKIRIGLNPMPRMASRHIASYHSAYSLLGIVGV